MTVHPGTSIDPQRLADQLGLLFADERCTVALAAAESWVQKRRSLTDPTELWVEPDVIAGTLMYAALLYQQRSQPQGFAGMDQLGSYGEDTGMAMSQVFRLVGSDAVIA
jgi:hypothetical protein